MGSEMASLSIRGLVRTSEGCFFSCGAGGAGGGGGASIAKRGSSSSSSSSVEVSTSFNLRRSRRAAWWRASN